MNSKFYYLVTDPNYLITPKNWEEAFGNTKGKPDAEFASELVKYLPKGSVVNSTGVGDYINSISTVFKDEAVNIIQPCFTVDSGMVCVAPVKSIEQYEDDIRIAIIESNEELTYGFDTTYPDWIVVEFTHGDKEVAQSEPYSIN